ncbi:endogenous retrovirus group K member 113 Gag polyprotein-like [Calypte anna]|uniref:endogenous retrovirus group K member 113 Gag polyprotein-like n=1 Tax=Calypte anna TaxID=9244 RepID=UPI0011C45245|nr:endogenous retrovirus group K member 113 Gag polyprotein-like [Calypte anna]
MESKVALDLLVSFLQKRSVKDRDLRKDLPALLVYGRAQRLFNDPSKLFDEAEWRELGGILCGKVIDKDETARKLTKLWFAVLNCLQRYQAEGEMAAVVADYFAGQGTPGLHQFGVDDDPSSPTGEERVVEISQNSNRAPMEPSAVPLDGALGDVLSNKEEGQLDEEAAAHHHQELAVNKPQLGGAPRFGSISRVNWLQIQKEAILHKDHDFCSDVQALPQAFPVTCTLDGQGNIKVTYSPLDWEFLTELRATVKECGLHGEPAKVMIDCIWGAGPLLPEDVKGIMGMITTPSELMLWQAHWQQLCESFAAIPRQQKDPMFGVSACQLMGTGPYAGIEAQARLGLDKVRESMRLAQEALSRVRTMPPVPSFMSMKQGREEPFGQFVAKLSDAISRAGVPEWTRGPLLCHCVLENSNGPTKSVLSTMRGDVTIEEMLEQVVKVPVGAQAVLIEAVQSVGRALVQAQAEAFAALAPLRPAGPSEQWPDPSKKCSRCGGTRHLRRQCHESGVWCQHCNMGSHATGTCRHSGNGSRSTRSHGVKTQTAALL